MAEEIIVDNIEVFDWRSALRNKEREYEELRQYHNKCCEENANELKDWLIKYSRLSRDFYSGKYCSVKYCKQIQAKEQKRNELFNCLKQANGKRYAYKQALDEIEEFCIVYSNNHDAYETVYKHILDIINKAKEKNNG